MRASWGWVHRPQRRWSQFFVILLLCTVGGRGDLFPVWLRDAQTWFLVGPGGSQFTHLNVGSMLTEVMGSQGLEG